jgi:hypothetical protein
MTHATPNAPARPCRAWHPLSLCLNLSLYRSHKHVVQNNTQWHAHILDRCKRVRDDTRSRGVRVEFASSSCRFPQFMRTCTVRLFERLRVQREWRGIVPRSASKHEQGDTCWARDAQLSALCTSPLGRIQFFLFLARVISRVWDGATCRRLRQACPRRRTCGSTRRSRTVKVPGESRATWPTSSWTRACSAPLPRRLSALTKATSSRPSWMPVTGSGLSCRTPVR